MHYFLRHGARPNGVEQPTRVASELLDGSLPESVIECAKFGGRLDGEPAGPEGRRVAMLDKFRPRGGPVNADRRPAANSHALRRTGLQAETVRLRLVEASSRPLQAPDRPLDSCGLRTSNETVSCSSATKERVSVATSRAGR